MIVVFAAMAVGVMVVVGIVVEQRVTDARLGGPGQKRLLQEALYTGKPPADIDRGRWIAYLRRRRPPPKLVMHAVVVCAVLIGVTVSDIRAPGSYGADELGHLVLLVLAFALVYAFRGRVLRGSIGWDRPAKAELLAALERDNRDGPHDL